MSYAIDAPAIQRDERTAVTRQVEALLARLHPTIKVERRSDERVPLPVLFRLTPLDDRRRPIKTSAVTVVGKNISRRGISFYHAQSLAYRRAVICVEHPDCGSFSAEIDISWCRFTKPGWYESGGRLLSMVSPEPAAAADEHGN